MRTRASNTSTAIACQNEGLRARQCASPAYKTKLGQATGSARLVQVYGVYKGRPCRVLSPTLSRPWWIIPARISTTPDVDVTAAYKSGTDRGTLTSREQLVKIRERLRPRLQIHAHAKSPTSRATVARQTVAQASSSHGLLHPPQRSQSPVQLLLRQNGTKAASADATAPARAPKPLLKVHVAVPPACKAAPHAKTLASRT